MATDSAARSNTGIGFIAASQNACAATTFAISSSKATGNATGVSSPGANATVLLEQMTLSGNGKGFTEFGPIETFGNNYITDANTGSPTAIGQQ